jgi:hypothetical protein
MSLASQHATTGPTGPWGWENAQAQRHGQPLLGALEIACYTDLSALDLDIEGGSGPYTILSPLAEYDNIRHATRPPRMRLVLRVDQYLSREPDEYLDDDWEQLDPAVHHGGNGGQELAALLSLALGIRLRSAGISRVFHQADKDARGYPHETEPPPYLPPPADGRRSILPDIDDLRHVDANRLTLLDAYPEMTAEQALKLVKSARAYQEAIWIADGDPRLAWLRLVTAAETVAQLMSGQPTIGRLRDADPELAGLAAACGDQRLIEIITEKLVDNRGVTRKFVDFLSNVDPPSRRPRDRRIRWQSLREQLAAIYDYRSKDLHAGTPFPLSLCQLPYVSRNGLVEEASSVTTKHGTRVMRIHVFEYIVRSALLTWWASIPTRTEAVAHNA